MMSSNTVPVGESSDTLVPEVSEVTTFLKVSPDSTNPIGDSGFSVSQDYGDMPTKDESIQSILSRPIRLPALAFSSSSGVGDVLATYRLPTEYFQNSSNALAKLINFQFLQCDVILELHANGSPTNAGLIMLVEVPQMNPRTTTNLRYWSSFPNKSVMDLGSAKDGVLRVSFKHFLNWSQVGAYAAIPDADSKTYFDFALIKVVVLSPYAGTGAGDAITLTPWMKLENVVVKMPTLPVVLPVGAKGKGVISAQGGPVEAVVKATNVALNTTATVTGAMRSLGHIVASKPNTVAAVQFVKQSDAATGPHATSLYPGVPLAMDAANTCPPRFSSTNIAEYCATPYIQNITSWDVTNTQGDILAYWDVNPCSLENGDTTDSYQPGPLDMAALMFSWWRGDIAFRPQFAKNAFVSGKLQFIFVAGDPTPRTTITSDEANQVYSWVVDIRSPDVPEMVINYVAPTPWRPCIPSFSNAQGAPEISPAHTGILYCLVLNPLVSGADASMTAIDMVMWKRGVNMEFAYPCQRAVPYVNGVLDEPDNLEGIRNYRPWPVVAPPEPRGGSKYSFQQFSRIYAQGGPYAGVTQQSLPLFPSQGGISSSQLDTMGERIQDFKELCLRMCFRDYIQQNGNAGDVYWWRVESFNHSWGWLHLFRHLFAYMHGSLRYQVWINSYVGISTSQNSYPFKVESKRMLSLTWADGSTTYATVLNTPLLTSSETGIDEVAIPWYCPTHFCPTNAGESSPRVWPNLDVCYPTWRQSDGAQVNENIYMNTNVSAGDDFCFAVPVAPPEVGVIVSESSYEVVPPPMNYFTFN